MNKLFSQEFQAMKRNAEMILNKPLRNDEVERLETSDLRSIVENKTYSSDLERIKGEQRLKGYITAKNVYYGGY